MAMRKPKLIYCFYLIRGQLKLRKEWQIRGKIREKHIFLFFFNGIWRSRLLFWNSRQLEIILKPLWKCLSHAIVILVHVIILETLIQHWSTNYISITATDSLSNVITTAYDTCTSVRQYDCGR